MQNSIDNYIIKLEKKFYFEVNYVTFLSKSLKHACYFVQFSYSGSLDFLLTPAKPKYPQRLNIH